MPKIAPIVDELNREARTTRRVLERVPAEHLGWKPHPKSRTLGELAWHLAVIPARISRFAQTDDADVSTVKPPPAPASPSEMVAAFDANVLEANGLLGRLDDESLARTLTFRRGETVIFELPRLDFLRQVLLNHAIHHRGQLSVYLRLLDVPVPSIYGPSADES